MKEIAEKYPLAWEDIWHHFLNRFPDSTKQFLLRYGAGYLIENLKFPEFFGYLILEYFPKHGIRIRQKYSGMWAIEKYYKNDGRWYPACLLSETPKEAITKAAEIRERKLQEGI